MTLRQFRYCVRQSAAGRNLVQVYYRYSPPLARLIARHEALRAVTRVFLTPIVSAIAYPYPMLAILVPRAACCSWCCAARSLDIQRDPVEVCSLVRSSRSIRLSRLVARISAPKSVR